MQPTDESASAAADGQPAGSSTRGLIGAIAGTAAVAAIATAVIIGSGHDSPKPVAKDGAVTTSASGAPLPKSSRSAPASSVGPGPSAGGSGGLPPGGSYTDKDLENLPTIPPVVTDQIPALDPTIPALPSSSETPPPSTGELPPPAPSAELPPAPSAELPPSVPSADAPGSTTPPPDASPAPTTPVLPPPPPVEPSAPGTTTTASPSYPTPPGTELTAEVEPLSHTARIAFTISNPGDPAKAAAYQSPTLTIGSFPGLSAAATPAGPSICTVFVDDVPLADATNKDCADTPLVAQLADIDPGQTARIIVDVALSTDVTGAVTSIPLTFSTGAGTDQGGFSVVFTATPSAPFEGPGAAAGSTDASAPTN